jgi:hypothetical protein
MDEMENNEFAAPVFYSVNRETKMLVLALPRQLSSIMGSVLGRILPSSQGVYPCGLSIVGIPSSSRVSLLSFDKFQEYHHGYGCHQHLD